MKIATYSIKQGEIDSIGWHRSCDNIAYFPNGIRRSAKFPRSLFTLRFSYTFLYSHDSVYFAYSFPYTMSQLNTYLDNLESDPNVNEFLSRKILCKTIAGNKCEYMTITSVRFY